MEHLPFGEVCNRKMRIPVRQTEPAISIAELPRFGGERAACDDFAGDCHGPTILQSGRARCSLAIPAVVTEVVVKLRFRNFLSFSR